MYTLYRSPQSGLLDDLSAATAATSKLLMMSGGQIHCVLISETPPLLSLPNRHGFRVSFSHCSGY